MDNASRNVPIVPPNSELGEINRANQTPHQVLGGMINQAATYHPQTPIGGITEVLLSKPSVPDPLPTVYGPETLNNEARLFAPTPIDFDPPPIGDVRPLSVPVASAGPVVQHLTSAQPVPFPRPVYAPPEPGGQPAPVLPQPAWLQPAPQILAQRDPGLVHQEPIDEIPAPEVFKEPTSRVATQNHLSEGDYSEGEYFSSEEEITPLSLPTESLDETELLSMSPEDEVADPKETISLPQLLLFPEGESGQGKPSGKALEAMLPDSNNDLPISNKTEFQPEVLPNKDPLLNVLTEKKTDGYVKNEFFVSEGAEDPWILPAAATATLRANTKKKRKAFGKINIEVWSIFTNLFFFGGILLIAVVGIAWLMRGMIGDLIEARLAKKVEEAGYFASYDGWNYDPVRGLVLEGVTVFENANKVVPYAKINNIGLNTDLITFWKTRDALSLKKTVSFRDSNLTLYDRGTEIANFKNLKGALELDQNKIGLHDLEGQLEGTAFEIEGDVILNKATEVISLWDAKDSSIVSIQARSPENLAETTEKEVSQQVVDASPAEDPPMFAPRKDIIVPTSNPEPAPKTITETDLIEPAPTALPDPGPANAITEPALVADPSEVIETNVLKEAEVPKVPDITVQDVVPDSIDLSEPKAADETPEKLQPASAPVKAEAAQLPSLAFLTDFVKFLKIKTEGTPPLLTSKINIDLTEKESPKIEAKGRFSGKSVTMEETIMRGITFRDLDAPYTYDHESGQLDLPGFTVGHGASGNLTGNASFNLKNNLLSLNEVVSNLDLVGFLTELDSDMKQMFKSVKFNDSPKIHIKTGQIPVLDPLNGELDFSYGQWEGMDIINGEKKLSLKELRGDFKLANGQLGVTRLVTKALEGIIDTNGVLKLSDGKLPYSGDIKARGVTLEAIAKYAGIATENMKGLLNLDYKGVVASDLNLLTGTGLIDLRNSQLYKVPVIGNIQRVIGAALPVFANQDDSTLFGHFIIESGVFTTPDLQARRDGTKVSVKGQINLPLQLTAFSATANLDGPLGIATGLIEEKIEVEGSGPLQKPIIRLKGGSLPSSFSIAEVKNMLGISDGANEALTAMMQEIAGGPNSNSVGEAINGLGGGALRRKTEEIQNKAVGGASDFLKDIKNVEPNSVTQGLKELFGGETKR